MTPQTETVGHDLIFDLVKIASIDDLYLALRAAHQGAMIEVTDTQGRVFKLGVQSIAHEDGSGRSFNVTGYAHLIRTTEKLRINGIVLPFKAYLNYKGGDRKGWIKV
jgi:hypothetical protein